MFVAITWEKRAAEVVRYSAVSVEVCGYRSIMREKKDDEVLTVH
jgi:hypothetical protein